MGRVAGNFHNAIWRSVALRLVSL